MKLLAKKRLPNKCKNFWKRGEKALEMARETEQL
jgi:hypothetical protein